jgi:hypothetical protein
MLLFAAAAASGPASDTSGAATPSRAISERLVALRYDPEFILNVVTGRMGIRLRPDMPPPTVLVESSTPLRRLQAAIEPQWGFRPHVFVTTYASAGNEIYLIDDAALYERLGATPDDALAHELVHYLQANYLKDRFRTDWSESEAAAIRTWFREEYMKSRVAAVR